MEHHYIERNGLDVVLTRSFLSETEEESLFDTLKDLPWYRVCYESERHGNSCETPCYTNFFGGFPELKPYQPVPSCFDEIIRKVSEKTNAKYNAILLRLYFDGNDNIAWHTDGRTFLGPTPVIASLSLGHEAKFQMRKMTHVWPCKDTPNGGIDKTVAPLDFTVRGGDLLVMQGVTQDHWHHRVPREKYRGPRININFRYIVSSLDELALRGIRAFYKYMVSGDAKSSNWDITATPFTYEEIMKKAGPIHVFVKRNSVSTDPLKVSKFNQQSINTTEKEGETACDVFLTTTSVKRKDDGDFKYSWTCDTCTFINENICNTRCDMCCSLQVLDKLDKSRATAISNLVTTSCAKKSKTVDSKTSKAPPKTLLSYFTTKYNKSL